MSDDGFGKFSVENAPALKQETAVGKVKARKAITAAASGKTKEVAGIPIPSEPPVPFHKEPVTKEQAAKHKLVLGKRGTVGAPADEQQQLDEAERQLAIKKYRGYFNGRHTRDFCGGVQPNDSWSTSQAKANLERVRDTANSQYQLDMTAKTVEMGLRAVTYVTHDMGINPRGWILKKGRHSVADEFVAHKDTAMFQPQLSEVGAEMGLVFSANCFARLGYSLFELCEGFSSAAHQSTITEVPTTDIKPQ
jgi:hypothetical protein